MKKELIHKSPATEKSLKRLLLSISNTSRSLLVPIFGLGLNYVLLHFKSPSLLNAYVYSVAATGLLQVLCNWGGREFIIREISKTNLNTQQFLGNVVINRFLFFIAVIPFLFLLPLNIDYPLIIIGLLGLRTVSGIFEPLITIRKKFHYFLFTDIILNLVFILLVFFDANTDNIDHFLLELLFIEFLKVLVLAITFKSEVTIRVDILALWNVVKSSFPFFLVGLAGFLCSRADLYALGFMMKANEMSHYYILLNMVILSHVLFYSFNSTFAINIFRYTNSSFKNFENYILKTGVLFALMGTVAIYTLYYIFFGIPLTFLFIILLFVNLLAYTGTFTSIYYFTRINRQDIIFKVVLSSGFLSVLLALVLVKYFGLNGAFAANTICGVFTTLTFKYVTSKTKIKLKK